MAANYPKGKKVGSVPVEVPEGKPLFEVFADEEAGMMSLTGLTMLKEAQASINLDGETQSLPYEKADLVGRPEPWKPPSGTLLTTIDGTSHYIVDTIDEVLEKTRDMKGTDFALILDVAQAPGWGGPEGSRVLVPWSSVAYILDLTTADLPD